MCDMEFATNNSSIWVFCKDLMPDAHCYITSGIYHHDERLVEVAVQRVNGDWELHLLHRRRGHREWFDQRDRPFNFGYFVAWKEWSGWPEAK